MGVGVKVGVVCGVRVDGTVAVGEAVAIEEGWGVGEAIPPMECVMEGAGGDEISGDGCRASDGVLWQATSTPRNHPKSPMLMLVFSRDDVADMLKTGNLPDRIQAYGFGAGIGRY